MTETRTGPRTAFSALMDAAAVDAAFGRYDAALQEQTRLSRTLADLAQRIVTLGTAEGTEPQSRLKPLLLRLSTTEKALDRARQAVATEREAWEAALEQGRASLGRKAALFSDLRAGLEATTRQNAALGRALHQQLLRQCAAQAETLPDAPFALPAGSYDYIAIGLPRFADLLYRLDRHLADDPAYAGVGDGYRPVAFLEVGCGPGHNLELARHAGLCRFASVTGFDINPDAIAMGRRAFGFGAALTVGDALAFDYASYDVIYSYRPFSNPGLQARLEQRLAETMRPDAYLIAPAALDLARYPDLTPVDPTAELWQKRG